MILSQYSGDFYRGWYIVKYVKTAYKEIITRIFRIIRAAVNCHILIMTTVV